MATPKAYFSTAILAGFMAVSAPALAEQRTAEVRVNDLNLSSTAGQMALENRIKRAIKTVCRSDSSKAASERQDVAQCEANARAAASATADQRIAAYKASNKRVARAD
jgi:UrcA family protein